MGLYGEEKKYHQAPQNFWKRGIKIFEAAFLTDTYIFKKTKETDCQLGALLS